MKKEEIIEAMEAIDNINADLFDQSISKNRQGHDKIDPFILMELIYGIAGEAVIEFLGECIWSTQDDEREWLELDYDVTGKCIKADHEPLEPYLRRSANELIVKLQKIKL